MKAFVEGFLDHFGSLADPRSVRNKIYPVDEILLTTLCAAIAGAEGWQDVEDFGNIKLDFLRALLPYKNGIPSDDTFRRFFRALNPEHFQTLFRDWTATVFTKKLDAQVIAIDGKAARHSFDNGQKMLHMVSAFASEARLVLGQQKVDEKSNEITAIPDVLKWLNLKGSTVTIDAMGCQHEIGKQIVEQGGDYIFSLKGNQGSLHEDVKLFLTDKTEQLMYQEDWDKGHGRIECRTCYLTHKVEWTHQRHPHWKTIKSLIRIDARRESKGKITEETRYYIASAAETPQSALRKIRSHWAIENSLHWVLDMTFGEDQSRIRKGNAPHCMAIIRHMAQNLLQNTKNQMPRQSIKRLRKMAGWENNFLLKILSQNFS